MKKLQKRMLVQLLFGFLIGRVVLLERNPAGAAFFAAGLVQGGGVLPLLASVGLGCRRCLLRRCFATVWRWWALYLHRG